jgi:maleamate amidohydrolase
VVRDACGDRHEAPHEANLFDIQAKFGEVIGEEDFMRLVDARR